MTKRKKRKKKNDTEHDTEI